MTRTERMTQICQQKHPTATITKVDTANDTVFFRETGDRRTWGMIFDGRSVIGVWDLTSTDDIDEGARQDMQRYNSRVGW
jgi:hypothetical protein